jgi:hypothetical protein
VTPAGIKHAVARTYSDLLENHTLQMAAALWITASAKGAGRCGLAETLLHAADADGPQTLRHSFFSQTALPLMRSLFVVHFVFS